jgi:hypothetical protein
MSLETILKRLSEEKKPLHRERLRREVLNRIEPKLLENLAAAKNPGNLSRLKEEVMARTAHPKLQHGFEHMKELLQPSGLVMERLRAAIFDHILARAPLPIWRITMKWTASVAAFALLFSFAPKLFLAPTIEASSQNVLIPTEGIVSVTKGAEWTQMVSRLELSEPLTVRTGELSAATIILGDTAVLRLDENTEVNLRPTALLPSHARNEPIARVSYGRLWATSLLPETLSTATTLVLPQGNVQLKNGSISLFVDPVRSTLQVYHRFADLMASTGQATHLIEGDQVTLLPEGAMQRNLVTKNMRAEEWVRTNLSRDAAHRTEVEEHMQELARAAAGILPTSTFYSILKRPAEKLDLAMTWSSESRREKQMQHAQTRLNEAIVLLERGEELAAAGPLAEYREAVAELASVTPEEAAELLTPSLILSTTTVASALPNTPLYDIKAALAHAGAALPSSSIEPGQVDLYLLSDALLQIEELIAQGNLEESLQAYSGIEGAVASVLERETLEETHVAKDSLQAIRTILRSITVSLNSAEETAAPELASVLTDLRSRVALRLPTTGIPIASTYVEEECLSDREVTRMKNQILSDIFSLVTPVGQRNTLLAWLKKLPDCDASGRVLAGIMNKVSVPLRWFVWEKLQQM